MTPEAPIIDESLVKPQREKVKAEDGKLKLRHVKDQDFDPDPLNMTYSHLAEPPEELKPKRMVLNIALAIVCLGLLIVSIYFIVDYVNTQKKKVLEKKAQQLKEAREAEESARKEATARSRQNERIKNWKNKYLSAMTPRKIGGNGRIDMQAVMAKIQNQYLSRLWGCLPTKVYAKKVKVSFVLDKNGTVDKLKFLENPFSENKAVAKCLTTSFNKWELQKPLKGTLDMEMSIFIPRPIKITETRHK